MAKIKVGLVEDQLLFREGMKSILSSFPEVEITFESPDGYSVLKRLEESIEKPDVLLVDLSLPTLDDVEFDGIAVTDAVLLTYPEMKVIILSVHDDDAFIAELIEHGAHGYLVKDCDPSEVREAILSSHEKGSYINHRTLMAIQKRMNRKSGKPSGYNTKNVPLTKREIEVLELVCQQMTTEEIAEKLFISMKTVNGHRNNLLQKTGSRNVAGLVIFAIKNDILDTLNK